MTTKKSYGIVNESIHSFIVKSIDQGPYATFEECMSDAAELIASGWENISIVRCKFSKARDAWVEDTTRGSIAIDAYDFEVEE